LVLLELSREIFNVKIDIEGKFEGIRVAEILNVNSSGYQGRESR
jgi:hypothetical protein